MKKKIVSAVCALSLAVMFGACTPQKTEYDNKTVLKIETYISGGEVTLYQVPTRTFDFEKGTVTDERILSDSELDRLLDEYSAHPEYFPEYESAESYQAYLDATYNHPEQISSFTAEQGETLLREIVSDGFYRWNDYYDEDEVSCGSVWYVTVSFADGTTKRTGFYLKHPKLHQGLKNYEKIETAFMEYCGSELFMEW